MPVYTDSASNILNKELGMKMGFVTAVVCAWAIGLAGCGGGGADTEVNATTTTTGQELIDLKRAYDTGVINKSQYEDQKRKILNNRS
jgi:hypothetical protein